jgi:uncharacterized protein (TIGR03437 family)
MRRLFPILVALTPFLFGYDRLSTCQTNATVPPPCPGVPLQRTDNTAIQFYLNDLVAGGVTSSASGSSVTVITAKSNPLQAVELAQAKWNSVTTANVNFLEVQSTAKTHDSSDCVNVISIAASASELSAVSGLIALTVNASAPSSGVIPCDTGVNVNVNVGDIVDSDILLNPQWSFSTDYSTAFDLQGTLTHEFGHALSANHSGLLGATMFQYGSNTVIAYINQRYLSMDDIAFVSGAYPAAGGSALGTIGGMVAVDGAAVPYALLTLIDTTHGITIGGLSNADGTYSVQVPAGSYLVYAEPFGIVQPGNLYLTVAEAGSATSVRFLSTFLGGNSNPAIVNVAANGASTGNNIAVTALPSGAAILAPPQIGFGAPGGSGDVKSVTQIAGPVPIASGESLDLAFAGLGFDATLTLANLQIYGAGITVTNVRVDPLEQFNINGTLYPLVRATITIPARQNAAVAGIFINRGSTALPTLSLSGVLVITPPTPAFTSPSVVSAATYLGSGVCTGFTCASGAVSPGGIYTIFPTKGTSNLGPAAGMGNAGFDGYGFLSANLAGVSVTFDGVAAPLFYVSGGLINAQVPFEVAGKTSTNVVVNFFGSESAPVAVPVLNEQPAFFTNNADGGTDSIVVNADGTVNSKTNPAARGTYVTAYGTGIGKVAGVVTGQGAPFENALTPNYTCTVANVNQSFIFPAAFVGYTPTEVGLAQFTFQVPTGVAPNTTQVLKCTDTATGVSTPYGTLYVGN